MNTSGDVVDGRFELIELLGSGGMGTVWRARDTVLDREVALKAVRPEAEASPAMRERVLREARALARLSNPHVVTIHQTIDMGPDAHPWLVMELVPGVSLQQRLQDGPLEPGEAARIGRQVLSALRAAHDAGVRHRDVKPANVLIRRDGTAVLTDFGIAALQGTTALTVTGELVGSPEYMAPERVRGHSDLPASDLWSLGLVLYVCTEGVSPLRRSSTLATLAAVLDDPVPPPARSGPLAPVLEALLVRDPAARPDTETLDALLARVEGGETPRWDRPTIPAPVPVPDPVPDPTPAPAPTPTLAEPAPEAEPVSPLHGTPPAPGTPTPGTPTPGTPTPDTPAPGTPAPGTPPTTPAAATAGPPPPPPSPSRPQPALLALAAVAVAAVTALVVTLVLTLGADEGNGQEGNGAKGGTSASPNRDGASDKGTRKGADGSPDGTPGEEGGRPGDGTPDRTPETSPGTSPAVTPPAGTVNGWIAQLYSAPVSEGAADRDRRLDAIRRAVPEAVYLRSDDYTSLKPGYWVIYAPGPFADGRDALDFCAERGRTSSNTCLGRYVSDSPDDFALQCRPPAADPTGRCSRT